VLAALAATIMPLQISTTAAQRLPQQCFEIPTIPADVAKLWSLAGTAIPSKNGLILSPGVSNRAGMLWSLNPVQTSNFEVKITISIKSLSSVPNKRDGFAIWYVYENATRAQETVMTDHGHNREAIADGSWATELVSEGFGLVGYRERFDGLGVVFQLGEQPTAGALSNDGLKSVDLDRDLSAENSVELGLSSQQELTIRLRIEPSSALIDIVGHGSVPIKTKLRRGGYIGLTAFHRKLLKEHQSLRPSIVSVLNIETVNHDPNFVEEDVALRKEIVALRKRLASQSSLLAALRQEVDALRSRATVK